LQTAPKTPIELLSEKPTVTQIKGAIVFYAKNNGINQHIFSALADCESSYRNICIIDTNGKLSCGPFQFQKDTFDKFCPDMKWHNSVKEDIMCAARVVKKGVMADHWKTCSKKIQ